MEIHKFFFVFILFATSCTSLIEVPTPRHLLLTSDIYSNDETATSSLLGIYIKMVGDNVNYNIPLACGYASDELVRHTNHAPLIDLYVNAPRATDAHTNRLWDNGFFYIYQANSVFEGCSRSSSLSPTIKRQIMAETMFIRAFWMYYLVNFFGELPLMLDTNFGLNAVTQRATVQEVYTQIIADLNYSIQNLEPHYVNGINTITTNERIRPNQSAAIAMLARTYLAIGNWEKAQHFATLIIENNAMYDTVSINQVFLKDNKEAIWQLSQPLPRTSDVSTNEGLGFVLRSAPATGGASNCSTISDHLLNVFDATDLRKQIWIGEFTNQTVSPAKTYLFPAKYKDAFSTTTPREQSTVLRLAEQFLIRAEARAHLGSLDNALNDLNIIRKRAGLQPLVSVDQLTLLQAILDERQVEFFAEWGHRWIDLKRMGFVKEVISKVLKEKHGGDWIDEMKLWPIPQTDIDRNVKIRQNAGYN